MPYISRKNNKINGLYNIKQPGYAEEFLNDNDLEVIAFRNRLETQFGKKKKADIAKLGTRNELITRINIVNSLSRLKNIVLDLAEIIYLRKKNTIE